MFCRKENSWYICKKDYIITYCTLLHITYVNNMTIMISYMVKFINLKVKICHRNMFPVAEFKLSVNSKMIS